MTKAKDKPPEIMLLPDSWRDKLSAVIWRLRVLFNHVLILAAFAAAAVIVVGLILRLYADNNEFNWSALTGLIGCAGGWVAARYDLGIMGEK